MGRGVRWSCALPHKQDANGWHSAEATHLELLGYVLVIVPYWEWEGCKGAGEREVPAGQAGTVVKVRILSGEEKQRKLRKQVLKSMLLARAKALDPPDRRRRPWALRFIMDDFPDLEDLGRDCNIDVVCMLALDGLCSPNSACIGRHRQFVDTRTSTHLAHKYL